MKQLGKLILWQRARDYLKKYKPIIIGVAGSTGKTIAKDAIAAALSTSHRVRSAPFSYNTPIGVALSILGVTTKVVKQNWYRILTASKLKELTKVEPDIIVLELGANQPGDIDYLANQLPFRGAVITNIQSAHLRLFTNKDLVAHEVQSLVVDIPTSGYTILNADDPLVKDMAGRSSAPVTTYGLAAGADIRLIRAKRVNHVGYACEVKIKQKIYELHLPQLLAEYHIPHFLAAIAIAHAMNLDIPEVIARLQAIPIPPGRMNLLSGYNQSTLLDDTYNASPESTLAALTVLNEYPATRKIAILGDMLDLGAHTITAHREIGKSAAQIANVLVCVGPNMRHAGASALDQGTVDVHNFNTSQDVGKWLHDFLQPKDAVLIKGSRDMHMEEVVNRLLADPNDQKQLVGSNQAIFEKTKHFRYCLKIDT